MAEISTIEAGHMESLQVARSNYLKRFKNLAVIAEKATEKIISLANSEDDADIRQPRNFNRGPLIKNALANTSAIEANNVASLQIARLGQIDFYQQHILQISERIAGKLNKMIADGHETMPFLIALTLAFIKDFSDIGLSLLGLMVSAGTAGALLPAVEAIATVVGWMLSGILTYFMWGKGYLNESKVRLTWYLLGFLFDNLPGINAMPMTVFLVIWAWHVVRKRARHAKKDLEELNQKTGTELEAIEQEMAT